MARRRGRSCGAHGDPARAPRALAGRPARGGSEALRGLLRPPLSWDSLMYHLLLSGTWLRDQNLNPVFATSRTTTTATCRPTAPSGFCWWMCAVAQRVLINLATLPHWCCSGSPPAGSPAGSAPAATGRSPRPDPVDADRGALRRRPYVDIFVGAVLLSALLRPALDPRGGLGAVILAGASCGLAAGTKCGVFYAWPSPAPSCRSPAARGGAVFAGDRGLAVAVLLGLLLRPQHRPGADPLA